MNSDDQLTDIFTKRLDLGPFEKNSNKLEMIDIYTPNFRGVLRHKL
jgi:hypothetical protein